MRARLVVVAARFLSNVLLALVFLTSSGHAEDAAIVALVPTPLPEAEGYLARYELNSPGDLMRALERADALREAGHIGENGQRPLAFVVHGPEARVFLRENYGQYKPLVDLAAKLSAFEVVDVRVCLNRLSSMDALSSALPPFVGTVEVGPKEVKRLMQKEDYLQF